MPRVLQAALDVEPLPSQQVPVVVTLTSYGTRIRSVWQAIESLRWQTMKAAQIVLYLAAGDAFADPERWPVELHRQVEAGVKVRWVPDMGPYTKQVPALLAYPDMCVASFDDDEIYHPRALEQLWSMHQKAPKAVVCRRAHRIVHNADGLPAPYSKWKRDTHPLRAKDQENLVFTGVAGVLYPPGSLDPRFSNEEMFRRLAPHCDDLWMYAMAQLAGTPTRLATSRRVRLLAVAGTQDSALWKQNVHGGNNDQAMSNLIREFGYPFSPASESGKTSVA